MAVQQQQEIKLITQQLLVSLHPLAHQVQIDETTAHNLQIPKPSSTTREDKYFQQMSQPTNYITQKFNRVQDDILFYHHCRSRPLPQRRTTCQGIYFCKEETLLKHNKIQK